MLRKVDALENKLTERERNERHEPLGQLRRFIRTAAGKGGVQAPVSKSWLTRGTKDIRIDLEVHAGKACVPDHGAGSAH